MFRMAEPQHVQMFPAGSPLQYDLHRQRMQEHGGD